MSLTDISYYFRKLLPFTIFGFVLVILFYFFIKVFFAYLDSSKPSAPTYYPIFSVISAPKLIDPATSIKPPDYPANSNFIFDSIEGHPVTATDAAKVFFLPENPTRLGYVQNAYIMAKSFGFDPDIKYQLVDKTLTFQDDTKKLTLDISNFNFQYDFKFENSPALFQNTLIPDQSTI